MFYLVSRFRVFSPYLAYSIASRMVVKQNIIISRACSRQSCSPYGGKETERVKSDKDNVHLPSVLN